MSAEVKKEIQLEIAHVLFIDVVGYSKLSINEQRAAVDELNEVVRSSEQFQKAEAAARLIKIPTGDGMALVFYTSPEAPAQCAIEISRALKEHPHLKLRMGVHSGPVSGVIDVNGRANLAGAGLNMAQRVMDCGDAGHILLSRHVAEDLGEYEQWRPLLHDLGTCEVKHGVRMSVVNLYGEQSGNPGLPKKFQILRKKKTRTRWAMLMAALLALAAIGTVFVIFSRNRAFPTLPVPQKSIAVLPFENLSANQENAFFTDGVQNEILADLAKVADLKVISRTSVMLYKSGNPRNLREIGQQLGVAHVLEGSVQRSANRVRVTAQLIDARTDAHLWAQTYDRDLADVFAIQSEIAKTIADQLQARLSPTEKAAIERPPTTDLVAFDLYVRATALIDAIVPFSGTPKENLLQAVNLLDQAIGRDPGFLLAYCKLAFAHDFLYLLGLDHTPSRLALADAAVKNALRLGPDSGDAHLARAQHLYSSLLDYDGARAEIGVAHRTLPNNPRIFELSGYIDRRQGRWEESTRNLERAIQLDPRNVFLLNQTAFSYQFQRRYSQMAAALDRALALKPNDTDIRLARARVEMEWKADTRPWHALVETILKDNPGSAESIARSWLYLAFCEHDSVAAARALAVSGKEIVGLNALQFSRAFYGGLVARMKSDVAAAQAAFTEARAAQEQIVQAQPDYGPALCVLGLIDAGLARKEDALREGRRAIELLPVTKDSIDGAHMIEFFAIIAAWVGEKDLALQQLAIATQIPGTLSYGQLRLHPYWDPLRGDPRFEKIVASLAPKDAAK
jgi:TolB-like protein/class 3 adenylate cyclase